MKPLVSTDWLGQRLHDEGILVLDCRFYLGEPQRGHFEYLQAHIPTAGYVSLEDDMTGSSGPGRHPLPRPAEFVAKLRQLGISNDHAVIIYDDGSNATAARMWWMMWSLGHPSVAVLDGGWSKWDREPRSATREIPNREPTDLELGSTWRGTMDFEDIVANPDLLLVDSRDPQRYRGDEEPIDPVAGHIPGAINLPYVANTNDAGMLSSIELVERFRSLDPDRQVVFYCGSGVTACNNVLAAHLAGRKDTLLYPGSWSDWSSRDAAVATGDLTST